jgi:hypothetical protein
MDSMEQETHSFIVKIWRERAARQAGKYTWRGQISHVPDGARRSIRRFDEIMLFIAPYLLQLKVDPGWRYRLLRLLTRVFVDRKS